MGARTYNLDVKMILDDGKFANTSSRQGRIGGISETASEIDLGGGFGLSDNPRSDLQVIIDLTGIDISSNDEVYRLLIQGSNDVNFASGVENLAVKEWGAPAVLPGAGGVGATPVVGRYEIGFTNEQADRIFRYIRAYWVVAGTTPSIQGSVWLAQKPGR
ncbi:hypothetical protein SLNSH_16990 [Alsobacter soli]|uniref:Uncharacterized protein n=1 Tax=Alsobacter soli TaxID=2109933 RepID=A0A2T1HQ78_9HYPH|nr:hypothetical protein [Alsobacter soli]PSC03805.1 hypothetical protein SLNSH_16990 [Alsobacter soli]